MNTLQLMFKKNNWTFTSGDKMKIGIYGSAAGAISSDISDKARELGKQIAHLSRKEGIR